MNSPQQLDSPERNFQDSVIEKILFYLQGYRQKKGKRPDEVASTTDALAWICSRLDHFERNIAAFGKERDFPLLAALQRVLQICIAESRSAATEKPNTKHVIEHTGRSVMQELTASTYGDVELGFFLEGNLIEEILTLAEQSGLLVDERRPKLNADGSASMGFKFDKIGLENDMSAITNARIREGIARLGEPLAGITKRMFPAPYHKNQDPQGRWDFSNCV